MVGVGLGGVPLTLDLVSVWRTFRWTSVRRSVLWAILRPGKGTGEGAFQGNEFLDVLNQLVEGPPVDIGA